MTEGEITRSHGTMATRGRWTTQKHRITKYILKDK